MPSGRRVAVRSGPDRTCLTLIAAAVLWMVALAPPAAAIGAQGVDLQPLLDRQDGLLTATVGAETTIPIELSNIQDATQTVNVTAVSATRRDDGSFQLGTEVDWVELDQPTTTIEPNETVRREAAVDLAGYRDTQPEWIALVMAVEGGGNVTARAATIVQLRDAGASLPVPVSLVLISGSLVLMAAVMWWRVARDEETGLRLLRRQNAVPAA